MRNAPSAIKEAQLCAAVVTIMSEAREFPLTAAGMETSPEKVAGSSQSSPAPAKAADCQSASASASPAATVAKADASPASIVAKAAPVPPEKDKVENR